MKKSKSIGSLDKNLKVKGLSETQTFRWLPATDRKLTVQGLAWFHENRDTFFRLPLRAQKLVREPVWHLAQCPASARIAFRSDTSSLAVRATLRDTNHMPHMPMTGSNGLALFAGEPGGKLRPWRTAVPDQTAPSFERELLTNVPTKMREFRLYLPLYKALDKLEIGFTPGATILRPSPYALPRPVVFYGTSITQGGCANTAGTDFVSNIGRLLNLDVVNLGFSGNGKGEPELARLIAEIDASLYVLDYAANTHAAEMRKTLPVFIEILRGRRPLTPILLVSQVAYAGLNFDPAIRERLDGTRECLMDNFLRQRRKGDRNIHFVDGYGLIPFGAESATVDGGHPTDHGFRLMADRLAPALEHILLRDN
jgi:lysophospholipase L1-like esterase